MVCFAIGLSDYHCDYNRIYAMNCGMIIILVIVPQSTTNLTIPTMIVITPTTIIAILSATIVAT